jgi:hypothetical protein
VIKVSKTNVSINDEQQSVGLESTRFTENLGGLVFSRIGQHSMRLPKYAHVLLKA